MCLVEVTLTFLLINRIERENVQQLIGQLQTLGATKVLTYDALYDKSLRNMVKEWTKGKVLDRATLVLLL